MFSQKSFTGYWNSKNGTRYNTRISGTESLLFLVSAHVASDPRVGIFNFPFPPPPFFWAMKQCPTAAKIAGSIGILPYCVLNDFSHRGMNVCPICEASLSHDTLCMKFWSGSNNRIYMYHVLVFHWLAHEQNWSRPLTRNRRLFWP